MNCSCLLSLSQNRQHSHIPGKGVGNRGSLWSWQFKPSTIKFKVLLNRNPQGTLIQKNPVSSGDGFAAHAPVLSNPIPLLTNEKEKSFKRARDNCDRIWLQGLLLPQRTRIGERGSAGDSHLLGVRSTD